MRVHVVINTRAAQFRRKPALVAAMRDTCRGRAEVTTTTTLEELAAACHNIARRLPHLVVLCGGDGSYMSGVTALERVYDGAPLPAICLGPGGSSSTVARNWSALKRDPVQHVAAVLDRFSDPRASCVARPTLRVKEAGGAERIGFIFGTGLVSTFFDEFYAAGGGGYPQALRLVARVAAGAFVGGALARKVLSPLPCRLRVDGAAHPANAFTLIVASVVRNLGLHLLVTHRAGEDPDRPHLVASTLGVRECGMQYGRVLTGRPLMGAGAVDTLVGEFSVTFPAGGSYVLDGDPIASKEVAVRAGPRLQVISLPK